MSDVDEMSWRQQLGDKSVSLYLFVTMKVSIMRSEFEALDLVNPRNPSTSRTESENDVASQTTPRHYGPQPWAPNALPTGNHGVRV